jgi:hypothetical protein
LGGGSFNDIHELKALLRSQPRVLARNFLQQLLFYSTGTPARFSDRREIDHILDRTGDNGYRVRDLLYGLVSSRMFGGRDSQ